MQNAAMAQALGVKIGWIYAISFGLGAGLAGLCGALYAPTMTLIPTMGATFIVESFVTVVVGGANVLLGTAPAGGFARASSGSTLNAWIRPDHRPDRHAHRRHPRHPRPARRHLGLCSSPHALSASRERSDAETPQRPADLWQRPRASGSASPLVLALALVYPVFAIPYDVGNFAYLLASGCSWRSACA